MVIATVITATNNEGIPNRTTCESASTSLVVRATRSPVPARSTVDRGRLTARATNCSRSWANTVSPEDERQPARSPGQTGLRDDGDGQADGDPVHGGKAAPAAHLVDEPTDQPRGGEGGQRGEGVQGEDTGEQPAMAAHELTGVLPDRAASRRPAGCAGRGR